MTRPSEILGSVVAASEREQPDTFLDYLRDAVVRKVRGVSEEDARRSPVSSGTSLGGLIKHLRWVELGAFAEQIGQIPAAELPTPPWTDADPEADLRLEPDEKLDDVIGAYHAECDRSREIAAQHSLDCVPPGGELTLRWVYLHVILETSRHAGHADIVREMIDRSVGD
ncbi:DinB family protein [Brevibacterium permense]|uniref:DinB family protein n=1 Tax=Brevibacterium permense TaxID=234834 RepID=UPI0021CF4EFB|nr:DinB family protein [Brevibacterium permense]MCU4297515.1 DinB family protein [Brevibacterium permense]